MKILPRPQAMKLSLLDHMPGKCDMIHRWDYRATKGFCHFRSLIAKGLIVVEDLCVHLTPAGEAAIAEHRAAGRYIGNCWE